MKHYHRKKFFYKLFLRKSPRNAALFGVSLIALLGFMTPGIGFLLMPYTLTQSGACIRLMVYVSIIVIWLYAFIVLKCAYSGILRKKIPQNSIAFHACSYLSALIYQLGGATLSYILFKQKRYFFGLTGIFSALCGGISIALIIESTAVTNNFLIHILLWSQVVLLLITIAGYKDRHKIRYTYLWPFITLMLYMGSLFIYNAHLDKELQTERNRISQLLGHSIELKDFWKEQKNGLQLDEEPLKSLLTAFEKSSFDLYAGDDLSQNERMKKLQQWKSKNPGYVKAIDAFLKHRVEKIGQPYTNDPLMCLMLSELNALRDVARYLSYDISANCDDRKLVLKRNSELEKIRNWLLGDYLLLSKLVAMTIERIRLNAMAYPLKTGVLTVGDWNEILSCSPNWETEFADAMGGEATMMQSLFGAISSGDILEKEFGMKEMASWMKFIPLELSIYFKRDHLYGLTELNKQIKLIQNPEKTSCNKETKSAQDNSRIYIITSILLPAYSAMHLKPAEMNDCYNLLKTAIKIMAYRNKHGRLPENLNFLGKIPVDSVNNQPFRYEHGKIKVMVNEKPVERFGYRLYTRDEAGIDIGGLKAKNTFTVILEP